MSGEIFYTVQQAQVLIEMWRRHYNRVRAQSPLGYRPPAPDAAPGPPIAVTPADVYLGRHREIQTARQLAKMQTLIRRRWCNQGCEMKDKELIRPQQSERVPLDFLGVESGST